MGYLMNAKTASVEMKRPENAKVKEILSTLGSMKTERRPNEQYYLKAATIFDAKEASHWCVSSKDRKRLASNSHVYSGVGRNAIRRNTNFFMSNATPETGVWWRVRPLDAELMENQAVADWAKKVERKVQAEQRKSLYIALRKCFREMHISYGIVYQGIRRDRGEKQRSVFYEHVPSHKFWYRKNIYGEIFQASWEKSMSVEAFYEAYGKWPKGYETEAKRNGKTKQNVCVTVYVERNKAFKDKPTKAKDHEFLEYHIESKVEVQLSGYFYMPFEEIKLDDAPNSDYPVGIAYDALPDAMGANQARKTQLKALAYAGAPTLLTSMMDAVSTVGKQLIPSGFIEGGLNNDGKPNIAPIQGMFNPEVFTYAVAEDEARVRDTFMQNELLQTHSDEMTATAARIVAGERAAMVAPFVNSIMPSLTRLCENHIKILAEYGQIEPMPNSDGADLEINVVSPMAMQARAYEVASLVEAINYIKMLAELDPTVVQALDSEDALRIISEALGVERIIDLGKLKSAVEAMEQQQQQQQQVQMAGADAQIADTQASAMQKMGEMAGV